MVSRSPDITERTIIDLSGRLSTYYDLNGNAFDVALGGLPFIMAVTQVTIQAVHSISQLVTVVFAVVVVVELTMVQLHQTNLEQAETAESELSGVLIAHSHQQTSVKTTAELQRQ